MANRKLHLQTVQDMLPYFAASGHSLYAKSAYVYLQIMLRLPQTHPDAHLKFMEGYHVVRRSDRFWAGLSTDLIIEQVLMRDTWRNDKRKGDDRKPAFGVGLVHACLCKHQ